MSSHSSGILIAVLTFVTLVALTGYQVTSETSAVRLLGRLGAAMVELDRWLPAHREDIDLLARDRADQPIVLAGLPVEVAIPSQVVLEEPEPVLQSTIAEAMGRRMYEEGYTAVRDDQGETHLGLTEPLRWSIDALDSSAHGFWRIALLVTGGALAIILLLHVWTRQSPMPGVVAGSGIAALAGLLAWFGSMLLGGGLDGAIDEEVGRVATDGLWIGVRNGVAACAIGLGGLYAYNSLVGERPPEEEYWDEYDYETVEVGSQESPPY